VIQFASLSFDASISEVCMALLAGAKLCLGSPDAQGAGPAALTALREQAITIATLPPSVLAVLDPANFPTLQSVIAAGEACPAPVVARWATPERRFLNAYGPTETTVCATIAECRNDSRTPPIGQAIDNMQIYMLDQHLQPVPIGIPGEIYVGGVGLARGYHNRPDLTAEKFVPNPFSADPGARLYRTGDLGRYREDGQIEFLGRIDQQVKLRGFRIELDEIKTLLAQQPSVQEAVVVVREDIPGDQRLVGYLVADCEQSSQSSEILSVLRATLPEYMVPSAIVMLDALPLTPNGKIDRNALPAPSRIDAEQPGMSFGARDTLEQQLIQIMEETLNVRPISVTSNFFDLGGYSLLAVRMLAQIEVVFGKKLPLMTLFQEPTVEQLAKLLRQQTKASSASPVVALRATGSKRPLFIVHSANGVLLNYIELVRALDPDQPVYGLQSVGIDGLQPPLTTVETMAAHYLEVLRSVQPQGPYRISGWSFGGIVAYEMARQLQAQGEAVEHLILIDVVAPPVTAQEQAPAHPPLLVNPDSALWLLELATAIKDVRGVDLALTYDDLKQLDRDAQFDLLLERLRQYHLLPAGAGLSEIEGWVRVSQANIQAMIDYAPCRYDGPIILFRSTEAAAEEVEPSTVPKAFVELLNRNLGDRLLGWGSLTDQPIEVHTIPGNHMTMLLEPHVRRLTEQLAHYLDDGRP
jgi:thioesterase domain-containing protein/acyl carrier protein